MCMFDFSCVFNFFLIRFVYKCVVKINYGRNIFTYKKTNHEKSVYIKNAMFFLLSLFINIFDIFFYHIIFIIVRGFRPGQPDFIYA